MVGDVHLLLSANMSRSYTMLSLSRPTKTVTKAHPILKLVQARRSIAWTSAKRYQRCCNPCQSDYNTVHHVTVMPAQYRDPCHTSLQKGISICGIFRLSRVGRCCTCDPSIREPPWKPPACLRRRRRMVLLTLRRGNGPVLRSLYEGFYWFTCIWVPFIFGNSQIRSRRETR